MRSDHTNGHSFGRNNGSSCVFCEQPTVSKTLSSTKDILACLDFFKDKNQEYFVTLSLDGAGNLILRRIVTIGLLDMSLAHPREVFAGPLTDRAASIIIAHNHPSGISEPRVVRTLRQHSRLWLLGYCLEYRWKIILSLRRTNTLVLGSGG